MMSKPQMLITGGEGDLAIAIGEKYSNKYDLFLPSSKELDVTNLDNVKKYVGSKTFDVVINNAGTIHPRRILESDEELWQKDIQVNLIGSYFVSKNVLERNSNAIVVNVSSTAAFNYYSNWSSYCASKAGVVTLTKCLANDGFKVFCLCPGAIKTKFRDGLGLSNANAMSFDLFLEKLDEVISGAYEPGDAVMFRKNESEQVY